MKQETRKEGFYEDGEDERKVYENSNYYRVLVGTGNAQWWATLGASTFAIGAILIALAYCTLRIIQTVPSNYVGIFPAVSFEAYSIGILVTAAGVAMLLYSRYKLAKISWIK